jgi:hypothetical protein
MPAHRPIGAAARDGTTAAARVWAPAVAAAVGMGAGIPWNRNQGRPGVVRFLVLRLSLRLVLLG